MANATLGFMLAPLVPPLLFLIAILVGSKWPPTVTDVLAMPALSAGLGYAAALTFGLLGYVLRPAAEGPLYYVVGGALSGIGVATIANSSNEMAWFLGAGAGASSGLAFWVIVVWRTRRRA